MLFYKPNLDTYRKNAKIQAYLNYTQKMLINQEEMKSFLNWIPLRENITTRIPSNLLTKKNTVFSKMAENNDKYVENNISTFIQDLSENICGEEIMTSYGRNAVASGLDDKNKQFDVCFLVHDNYLSDLQYFNTDEHVDKWDVAEHKLRSVCSFIVVEKGECTKMPEIFSVRLICSLPNIKVNVLMGAYLYMIKTNHSLVVKKGILSLSGAYKNLSGFCSYSKFGFKTDLTLSGINCFEDKKSLPMSVELSSINESRIIDTVVQNRPISQYTEGDQELCTTLIPQNEEEEIKQHEIAGMYNSKYRTEIVSDMLNQTIQTLNEQIKEKKRNYKTFNGGKKSRKHVLVKKNKKNKKKTRKKYNKKYNKYY